MLDLEQFPLSQNQNLHLAALKIRHLVSFAIQYTIYSFSDSFMDYSRRKSQILLVDHKYSHHAFFLFYFACQIGIAN